MQIKCLSPGLEYETTEYNQASIIVKNVKKYFNPYDFLYYSPENIQEMTIQTKAKKIETDDFY